VVATNLAGLWAAGRLANVCWDPPDYLRIQDEYNDLHLFSEPVTKYR